MNIAQSIIDGNTVSSDSIKYLLWLTLVELQAVRTNLVETIDIDETFDINKLLSALDLELGILP